MNFLATLRSSTWQPPYRRSGQRRLSFPVLVLCAPSAYNLRRVCVNYKYSLAVAVFGALAYAPANATAWEQKHFNPAPDADDVVIPMPCEGAMVFRKVVVPLAGPLQDQPIHVGQDHTGW